MISRTGNGYEKLEELARNLLLIYIAECTAGGSGRWLEIGPLSIRMVLFAACFVVTLPFALRAFKTMIRSAQVMVTVCFGLSLLMSAGIGIVSGNKVGFIWSDLTGFMSLALIPGFVAVMRSREAIRRAVSTVFGSTVVLALVSLIMHLYLAFASNTAVNIINNWINRHSLGGMATLHTGLQRFYLKSHIFLQVAVIYGVWLIKTSKSRSRTVLLILCEGVMLFVWLISYTRGFWLGLAISAVCVLIFERHVWKRLVAIGCSIITVLVILLGLSGAAYRSPVVLVEFANRLSPKLLVFFNKIDTDSTDGGELVFSEDETKPDDSITDIANVEAVNMRAKSIRLLKERFWAHPIVGNGLGENLDEIRNDGRTEYMYFDILAKTGCIGFTLFLLTYFGFLGVQLYDGWKCWRNGVKASEEQVRNRYLTAAYIGIAVTSFFNPFLNNPMGVAVLMLTSTAIFSTNKLENR